MDASFTPILLSKRCSSCKEVRPIDQFFKDKNRVTGVTPRCKSCFKAYNTKTKNRIATYQTSYYAQHKERIIERKRCYSASKKSHDMIFRLRVELRHRLRKALKNDFKTGSAVRDLGCSIPELKAYIESRFQPGMSWDNWNRHGWHLDHIRPLVSFDLTDPLQFKVAVHFTNLQPLWALDNLKKGSSV